MAKGKHMCELLKKIRYRIANANGIEYTPKECSYKGDCSGTCPACEAELRYLEAELKKKEESGETICLKRVAEIDRLPIKERFLEWEAGNLKRTNSNSLMGCPAPDSDKSFEEDNMFIDGGIPPNISEEDLFSEPPMEEEKEAGAWGIGWGKEKERTDEIVMGALDIRTLEEETVLEAGQLQGRMICEADRQARTFWGRIKRKLDNYIFSVFSADE